MTTTTSIAAHELALTVINDGKEYQKRCALARRRLDMGKQAAPSLALGWVECARKGAFDYYREFGDGAYFTPADRIGAALELAEYYETHVKEMDIE